MTRDISEHKYLFHRGTDHRCYEIFGAHRKSPKGYIFRVWAPDAEAVSLVGDFNGWDTEKDPMKRLEDDDSIWEASSDDAKEGDLYKFAIRAKDGRLLYKADPYAFESESARAEDGSQRASRIYDISKPFTWHDDEWMKKRNSSDPYKSPMNIYEVHLGSWKHNEDGSQMTYDEIAEELIPYVKDMGYTHMELLPVMEHPFDGSWGYQITGYYSVTSRYGKPEGFKKLIDAAHAEGIGVILTGCRLISQRTNTVWWNSTAALFTNTATPSRWSTKFLQDLNKDILTMHKGVLMIAEESTAWPNVTKPPVVGGLGFNFKWNMGWMNDALEYFQTDAYFRKGSHNKLTFAITYAYSENFILPISHDEVVHGKRSLLDKMPGEYDDKFRQLKCFLVYMMTHPGKKLTFMGQEIGQFIEWDEKRELDWLLLEYDRHRENQQFVSKLNKYYLSRKALWFGDNDPDGFRWIDADNAADNVYTYYRLTGEDDVTLVCLNLSGRDFEEYDIGVPDAKDYKCVIDTTDGAPREGKLFKTEEGDRNGHERYITVSLPKYSAMILEMGDAKHAQHKKMRSDAPCRRTGKPSGSAD